MSAVDTIRPASTRVSVARLAEQVIVRSSGVSATQGRGRWLTPDGERVVSGVVVGMTGAGRVDVALHLIAAWPPRPLPPIAAQLRRELASDAAAAGLGDQLGEISVTIHDLADPGEQEAGR